MARQEGIGTILEEVLAEEASALLIKDGLFFTPARHIVGRILARSTEENKVYLEWYIHPIFVSDVSGANWGSIGAKKTKYLTESVAFPVDVISRKLCRQVLDEVLPLFRNICTTRSYYQYTMNRALPLSLWPGVHFVMELAMGNLDAAEMLMRWHRKRCFAARSGWTGPRGTDYLLALTLCDLLDRGDVSEIGRALREAEATNAEKLGILQLWQPSLFPFETDADETKV